MMISVYAVDLYIIKPYKLGSFATVFVIDKNIDYDQNLNLE